MSTLPGPEWPGPGGTPGSDSRRLLFVMAVVFLLISLFQFMAPPPRPARKAPPAVAQPSSGPAAPGGTAPGTVSPAQAAVDEAPSPETIHTLTGEGIQLGFSSHGARVVQARLSHFLEVRDTAKGQKAPHVDLATLKGEAGGQLRFGFDGLSPTASYKVVQETPTSVVFEREAAGWRVRRSYQFDPTHFGLKSGVELTNLGAEARTIRPTLELNGVVRADEKDQGSFFSGGAPINQTTFLCADDKEI